MAWSLVSQSVLDEIADRIDRARRRVLIASPYIGRSIGHLIAARIGLRRLGHPGLDLRLLTAFVDESLRGGFLSVQALERLVDAGVITRSIPNLHAGARGRR